MPIIPSTMSPTAPSLDAVDVDLASGPAAEVGSPHHPLSTLAPLPPSPSVAIALLPPSRRPPPAAPTTPLWLDGIIGALIAVVVVLVARRLI